MKMENRAVTFPQTRTILNGVKVPNVSLDDIQAILNMRDAWKYLLGIIREPVDIGYFCKLNEFNCQKRGAGVGKASHGQRGNFRNRLCSPVPEYETVKEGLEQILLPYATATETALEAFVWGTRGQFFWDGNKRTSMTLANKILIEAGAGMLTITDKHMEGFNILLLDYYNTGASEELKEYLYKNAIQGMTV